MGNAVTFRKDKDWGTTAVPEGLRQRRSSHLSVHRAQVTLAQKSVMPGQHWWWPRGLSSPSGYAVAGPVAVAWAAMGAMSGSGLHTVVL